MLSVIYSVEGYLRMSRMIHIENQSLKNSLTWDYYILCRLDSEAGMILQHIEENEITQDTSAFRGISQEELKWRLMGVVGTNRLASKIRTLVNLKLITAHGNPNDARDRRREYRFAETYVQSCLDIITSILTFFDTNGYDLKDVCRAIESLTRRQVYIGKLSIPVVQNHLNSDQSRITNIKSPVVTREKLPTPTRPDYFNFPIYRYSYDSIQQQHRSATQKALSLGQTPTLTLKEWVDIVVNFDFSCAYCGLRYELLEHFIPLNYNGLTTSGNCVPGCYSCNNRKGGLLPQNVPVSRGMTEALHRVQRYLENTNNVDEVE